MKHERTSLLLAIAGGSLCLQLASPQSLHAQPGLKQMARPAATKTAFTNSPQFQISKPYSFGNLSIFLIKGEDKVKGQTYLTLREGVAQKKVLVKETGDVNTLTIDNLSNATVFIQSGQIVKGGQQDRALQSDMLIPPHTKGMALPCFCVEHGRWSQRVGESVDKFDSANDFVVGNSILLPVKRDKEQEKVWASVQAKQVVLSTTLAKPVTAHASPSSMQLTIEAKSVRDATKREIDALEGIVAKEQNSIGYAVAINGKISNADIYASKALFAKLWPGLLKSAAVEAVAEKRLPQAKKPVTEIDVRNCLAKAENAKEKSDPVTVQGEARRLRYQDNSIAEYGAGPALQASSNGTIGPQGGDATYVTGVNTAGTVRPVARPTPSFSSFFFKTKDTTNGVYVHKNYIGK